MDLVIVESPSKAKTICKYLGSGYKVLASGGHVRDLPADKLGVNVHRNFEPEYEVYPQKENTIKQLKKELKYACKNEYSDIWNIEIKNNIVNFNNFIKFSKSTIWGTYLLKSVKNFPLLELALSLFEHKKEMNLIGFKLQTDISIAYINQSIKLNSQKIKSIKFFKNGRVDIKFSSPEIAREFITKWCGYPLNKIA